MSESFNNILIPVDLSINTEVAIEKGLDLSQPGTIIHLLYILNYASYVAPSMPAGFRYLVQNTEMHDRESLHKKMEVWKDTIEKQASDVQVCIWIQIKESIQKAIEKKAKQLNADLIIIGKRSNHSWFPFLNTVVPSKIARQTGIPVLTVKPGAIHKQIKSMIVPLISERADDKIVGSLTIKIY